MITGQRLPLLDSHRRVDVGGVQVLERVIQQQLDSNVTDVSDSTITEMRYWAIQHANPADFHNKTYWINA